MIDSVTSKIIFGLNSCGAFIQVIIVAVLILGLSAHCKKSTPQNAGTSDQSKKITESSESISYDDELSDRIKQLVKDLEYPDKVAEDFNRMAMAWKDEQKNPILIHWKIELSNAHQQYQEGKVSKTQIAKIEESILQELCGRIRRQFRNQKLAFELSDVIQNQQANCLGFSQIIYIVGNAVGISVKPIDVLEPLISSEDGTRAGHIACIINLFDGRLVMADVLLLFEIPSRAFKLEDQFIKIGNFLELRDKDNPLLIHKRIRFVDRKGLIAAIHLNRGEVYQSKGEYDRAILEYNKAIEIDTGFTKAYNNRGNIYKSKGEYDRAILDYTKAIEIDPSYAIAYANRGDALYARGELDLAILDFTKAIEINPKFTKAYTNRGIVYVNKGEFNQAILDFTKTIKIDPNDADAYNNRGGCYCEKEEYDQALLDFNKAIELNPNDAYAYTIRGNIYYVKTEYDRAILDYEKAIEINPEDAIPFMDRGVAYAELGNSEEATKDLLKALELDPELRESVKKISEHYDLDLKFD